MYLLGTSPAFKCGHKLVELPQMMRDTFERITKVPITNEARAQTTLPVKLGGFGLVCFGYCFVNVHLLIDILPYPYQCPAGTRA